MATTPKQVVTIPCITFTASKEIFDMKTQILKASFPLAALSLACSSAEVGASAGGIRGSLLRTGPMNELTSELIHTKNIHRRLDEGKDEGEQKDNAEEEAAEEEEEVAEEEEAAEEDYDYEVAEEEDESWETEDMQYADEEGEATTTYQSKVEEYEAQAVQLFETAPAEWNPGQLDLLFALFGAVLVSCCVLSAFFAYCCIFREDDDVPTTKKGRSLRKRRHHRDDDTVDSENMKNTSLLPKASGSRTFSPRSWVSGSTYFSSNDESDAEDRNAKKYAAPSAAISPTGTVTSGGFARIDETAILHQHTGVTQKSEVPHPNSGITMKSEVVEM